MWALLHQGLLPRFESEGAGRVFGCMEIRCATVSLGTMAALSSSLYSGEVWGLTLLVFCLALMQDKELQGCHAGS